jgi:hypothetical protein
MNDIESKDFFRDDQLVNDPYPYLAAMRTTDIRIAEDKHGTAENPHYQYVPTFILRGLTELHLEFAL